MVHMSGCFIQCFDDTTAQELLDEFPEMRHRFTERQTRSIMNFFKQLLDVNSKDKNQCWGHVSCTLSELQRDHHHTLMRVEDRIGYHEAFMGWYNHTPLNKRMMISASVGLMIMVNLEEDDKYMLVVLYNPRRRSKAHRLMEKQKKQEKYDSMHFQESIKRGIDEVGWPFSFQPWFDALFVSQKAFPDPCTVVAGSLGLGTDPDFIWWEHGHKDWTSFIQFKSPMSHVDAYFWVEDEHGRIYDVLRPAIKATLLAMGLRLPNETFPRAVLGETYEEMARQGIHYLSASAETQHLLIETVKRVNKDVVRDFGLH